MLQYARLIRTFSRNEIISLIKNSKNLCRYPEFDIKSMQAANEYGRILIITSKKIGSAPKRNKARRRLRAIFYEEKLYLKHLDVVVFCKEAINNISFDKLKSNLINCLNI